ncbi:uncharacterized protein F4812DRAFT_168302 [Daldinia caldariorum]|uniref:uncharacterized protein n=1 Tax=Daldinia caldariorum TaxID=326644 RepID=UPI0020083637|nr:uncharacterized protein F4812DRAFT_168302 [Daldinia caldariorum]KAI1471160.1 hypothetical protein F4812DRAFT_168302 [Daldinia caldariorum]
MHILAAGVASTRLCVSRSLLLLVGDRRGRPFFLNSPSKKPSCNVYCFIHIYLRMIWNTLGGSYSTMFKKGGGFENYLSIQ